MNNLFDLIKKKDMDFTVSFCDRQDLFLDVNCMKEKGDASNNFENKYYFSVQAKNLNDESMGMISFNIENNDYMYFGLILVDPRFESKGVGTKLVEFMEFASQQKGIENIVGDYEPQNESAPMFYKKRGYNISKIDKYDVVQKTVDLTKVNDNIQIKGLDLHKEELTL